MGNAQLYQEGWLRPVRKCCEATLAGADGVVEPSVENVIYHLVPGNAGECGSLETYEQIGRTF
jgi:hypothetical protein